MKHSIRSTLTLIFVGVMALIMVGNWAVNSFFLEDFYTNRKTFILERAYTVINKMIVDLENQSGTETLDDELESLYSSDGEQTELSRMLRVMSEKYNTNIAIIDSMNDSAAPSARDVRFLADRVQRYILGRNDPSTEILVEKENYTIQKSYEPHSQSYYLESWGFFEDNRTIFIMSMPIASIHESVALSTKFMTYVGIAALIIGMALVSFAAKRLTDPIRSLTALSERMSQLDFSARYMGNAEDEIGVLGHSMNVLSEKLEESIGELKTANNQLQRDIEEKIRIDETRKDFIANVSHELKTPIALIQGYAEGLTEGMAEDPESRDYYCEVIMDEANKMNKMVKQLLTLTALEFGNDKPVMERFDLTTLVRGIVSSASILIQQKEAEVIFTQEEPVYVWADEFKIEEVVTNYLNNALNHVDGERKITISFAMQEDEVKVSVFNTGKPIPEEDLGKLWTKFFKVDKARTRSYGGSGIGLSIVKAIMDSHNKSYGVENHADGVEFWFTLDANPSTEKIKKVENKC